MQRRHRPIGRQAADRLNAIFGRAIADTRRGLDLSADHDALVNYRNGRGPKPTLRTRATVLSLPSIVTLDGDKAAFCALQRQLFDEAEHNFNGAFLQYWGGIGGAIFGAVGGGVGGYIAGGAAIAAWFSQEDDWVKTMDQAVVTMDATAQNIQQAGC